MYCIHETSSAPLRKKFRRKANDQCQNDDMNDHMTSNNSNFRHYSGTRCSNYTLLKHRFEISIFNFIILSYKRCLITHPMCADITDSENVRLETGAGIRTAAETRYQRLSRASKLGRATVTTYPYRRRSLVQLRLERASVISVE